MANLSSITLPNGDNYDLKDLNAAESIESTGGSGVRLKKRNGSSFSTSVKINTRDLVRPSWIQNDSFTDPTLQPLISTMRANRLAFLPADQIIIEKTIDGGTTWTDAGVSDATKLALFSETRPPVAIPRIDGKPNLLCGLRITFTAMKYNVPSGTAETEKYNYWSSQYVKSAERYCQLKEIYFWLNSNDSSIGIVAQRATGASPNNWITIFNDSSFWMRGWSGADYISFPQAQFGGGTNQTSQPWNYRLILMTRGTNGTSTIGASTNVQSIQEIRGYGDNVWTIPNQYMAYDHIYAKDANQNVTFPANVTATNFSGKVNNHTVDKDVPSDAVFTDTKPSAYCETAASTAAKVGLMTYFALRANEYVHLNFRYSNTAASALTLNINSTGAKPIYINGTASSSTNYTLPAGSYIAYYDGTNYYFRTDGKLPANISGDAATVNNHTVNTDVPSGAIFTDTTNLTQMTGVLPAANGGTGATSLRDASNDLINALKLGNDGVIVDRNDYFISQLVGGNTYNSETTQAQKYYRRKIDCLFGALNNSDITNALGYIPYTKGQTDALVVNKADAASTISGYGITDAYTKTEIDSMISSVFKYKGTKQTYTELSALTGMAAGDVWYVVGDGSSYAYSGSAWQSLGSAMDLSPFLISENVKDTEDIIING